MVLRDKAVLPNYQNLLTQYQHSSIRIYLQNASSSLFYQYLFFPVAFTAAFPGFNRDMNIGENAAIRFNKIVTNIGNGYNPLDGHFTAPYAGVYAFFASLRTLNVHGYTLLGIYKGPKLLASVTAEGRGDPWDRSSTFVVTHLDKGDQVYVRRYGGETWLEAGVFTTFSGILVTPD